MWGEYMLQYKCMENQIICEWYLVNISNIYLVRNRLQMFIILFRDILNMIFHMATLILEKIFQKLPVGG